MQYGVCKMAKCTHYLLSTLNRLFAFLYALRKFSCSHIFCPRKKDTITFV